MTKKLEKIYDRASDILVECFESQMDVDDYLPENLREEGFLGDDEDFDDEGHTRLYLETAKKLVKKYTEQLAKIEEK